MVSSTRGERLVVMALVASTRYRMRCPAAAPGIVAVNVSPPLLVIATVCSALKSMRYRRVALVWSVMVALTVTGSLAAGEVGVAATLLMWGPMPLRRTELAAPGVRPLALVAAAQLTASLLFRVASMSSRDGPVPSARTGQGSTSRNETVSMVAPLPSLRATVSPEFDRLPP